MVVEAFGTENEVYGCGKVDGLHVLTLFLGLAILCLVAEVME